MWTIPHYHFIILVSVKSIGCWAVCLAIITVVMCIKHCEVLILDALALYATQISDRQVTL